MPKLVIDQQPITVPDGTTLLEAARQLGIAIPTLCYSKDLKPNTSCMVCLVAVTGRKNPVPSCSTVAEEGMVVKTQTPAVQLARQQAVALLLSEHSGDCLALCQLACPYQLNIPRVIRCIQQGDFNQALAVIAERAPANDPDLCRTCRKPCETVCRRSRHDQPIAIAALVQTAQALADNQAQLPAQSEPLPRLKSASQIRRLSAVELTTLVDHAAAYDRTETNAEGLFDQTTAIAESKRCLHCDCRKNDKCSLRQTAEELQARQTTFNGERLVHEEHHLTDYIFEPAKCIRCGICVGLCEKAGIDKGFTFFNRGFNMRIGVPFDGYENPDLKGIIQECIAQCPTGAISGKD